MTMMSRISAEARSLHDVAEVAAMITAGDVLILAGEERLLAALPRGQWIGGTIPYFMTAEAGGVCDRDRIFVQRLPETARVHRQGVMDRSMLPGLAEHGPDNGFTVLLLPSQSEVHHDFALRGPEWEGLFRRPLVGWVTGVALDRLGQDSPKVFDGATATMSATDAVVLHVALPETAYARVDIVNLFSTGDGPALTFGEEGDETGFTVEWVRVDGVRTRMADYLTRAGADTRLPLVADYNGAMINVAVANIDGETGRVTFFAPVFPGITYRLSGPVASYEAQFADGIQTHAGTTVFSCNCILNYNYAGLEGQRTGSIVGPMSFGEIAYMLLTQTLVYLTVMED